MRKLSSFQFSISAGLLLGRIESFRPTSTTTILSLKSPSRHGTSLASSTASDLPDASFFDPNDQEVLEERLRQLRLQILETELSRPPTNTDLSPTESVQAILHALLHPYDPLPDAGFRLLLNTATAKWKAAILRSVGASAKSDPELVASALGSSIARPHNPFAILVGRDDEEIAMEDARSSSYSLYSAPEYVLDFPEPLDFGDGTCWVECRLRERYTGDLLVMTGWDLRQRQDDGAWLVDWIYWQDFRAEYTKYNQVEYLVA